MLYTNYISNTSLLLTNHDYKKINKLNIDDKLVNIKYNNEKIYKINYNLTSGFLYNIKIQFNNIDIDILENNLCYVKDINDSKFPYWCNINNLNKDKHLLCLPINKKSYIANFNFNFINNNLSNNNTNKCENIKIKLNDNNIWYFLGYFLNNGWVDIYSIKYIFYISIHNYDTKSYKKISKILNLQLVRKTNYSNIYLCSNKIYWKLLKKLHIQNGIPHWILNTSTNFINCFIEGLTNEYYKKNINISNNIEIKTDSANYALGLQLLFGKIGKYVYITKKKNKILSEQNIANKIILNKNIYYVKILKNIPNYKINNIFSKSLIDSEYIYFKIQNINKIPIDNYPTLQLNINNSIIVNNILVNGIH